MSTLCTVSLASIVAEICRRAGMEDGSYDVTDLIHIEVQGYAIINSYAASAALLALSQVFFFDPANYGGVIHFIRRGADTVKTIEIDEMIVTNDAAPYNVQRNDSISVPRSLHLNYYDIAGGLATDRQSSERPGDPRVTGENSLQTAVVLTADQAKRAVAINHKVMAEELRGAVTLSLSDTHLDLVVSDTLFVNVDDEYVRLRISQIDMQDGQQDYKMTFDRQSAYTSTLQGYPPQIPTPPPNRIVGPTLVEALDIHIIRDADDRLGCYVAVAGESEGWRGALVELSLDGGANYIDSIDMPNATIIGTLSTPINAARSEVPDYRNTLVVDVIQPDAELDSATFDQLLNRANMAAIGDEIIQFAEVNQDSSGTFYLGQPLLRGRLHTASIAHSIGERFVLLDRANLFFSDSELSYIGRSITIRATSYGATVDTATVKTFIYTGQSQTEYAPSYLQARRSGNNAIVQWQGVGKLGSGPRVAMGSYFSGFHLEATDGTSIIVLDTAATSATVDVSSLSGSITISVSQRNQLTGLGPSTQVTI